MLAARERGTPAGGPRVAAPRGGAGSYPPRATKIISGESSRKADRSKFP